MKFSIIIVNYNTKELLENCIVSLMENLNKNDYEIIIVDNNSTDGSVEMLEKEFSQKVKIIKNKNNIGFGAANNQGSKLAKEKYLFFLNSDTLVKYNIFNEIKDEFESNGDYGVIAPKLILENGEEQSFAYGNFPTLTSLMKEKIFKSIKQTEKKVETDWVSGAAMIVRKRLYDKVGGFDEKFFMYFEDIDLCKKIRNLGNKIVVQKNISLIHLGGKSINKNKERKKVYYESQNYFFKKYYGLINMYIMKLIRLPFRLLKYKNINDEN